MNHEITITNPTRTRKWGYGWSNTPTGHGLDIAPPAGPDYTGTLRQVQQSISDDKVLASMRSGGTFTNRRWFYDGKPVVGVKLNGSTVPLSEWLMWDEPGPWTLVIEDEG